MAVFKGLIRKYWYFYVVLGVVTVIDITMNLSIAWLFGNLTETAVSRNTSKFLPLLYVGIALILIMGINQYVNGYLKSRVSANVQDELRTLSRGPNIGSA